MCSPKEKNFEKKITIFESGSSESKKYFFRKLAKLAHILKIFNRKFRKNKESS